MQFFRRGIQIFRAFGVSIFIDYSWLIFFSLVVWTFGRFYFPRQTPPFGPSESLALGISAALLLFASVVFHEMSHAIVSNRLGFPIRRITLFIFGGVAHMTTEPRDAKTEFRVAVAGPLASLALWLFFALCTFLAAMISYRPAVELFSLTARLNFVLALFNLVPGFPLDGGRLFRSALWWKMGSLKRATNIAAKTGEIFAYLLMFFGVATIFFDRVNGWVAGIWYILIGIFLRNAAEESYQHVLIEEVLGGIVVGEIMGSNALAAGEGEPLATLVEKFLQHKFTVYPVLADDGRVVGVVDFEDVKRIPKEEWSAKRVADVMRTIPTARLPKARSNATDALRDMLTLGLPRLPVIDDGGKLAGIVTRADIMSMFQIRSGLSEEVVV